MNLFNFLKPRPKSIGKEVVRLFDKDIPLRIIKGKLKSHEVNTYTRYFDADGHILRYGDGVDDKIVRQETYQELKLHLKTIHYDGYMKPGHHEDVTSIYFTQGKLFENVQLGDIITYYGLFLNVGAVWTDYFLYNHTNGTQNKLYSLDTINERLFANAHNHSDLKDELGKGIEHILRNKN